jgi:transposase InsO family protein
MKLCGLPGDVYRLARLAERQVPDAALARFELVRRVDGLRARGLAVEAASSALGLSRATYYRWRRKAQGGVERLAPRSRRPLRPRRPTWPSALVEAVQRLREDFPMWGRAKLVVLVRGEGFGVSESTVGRILRHLVARGVVEPVPILRRAKTALRRVRRPHAQRLPKGQVADRPGALVQLDTLTITLQPGVSIKQFTAYCPQARWTVAHATRRATSSAAATFLDKVQAEMPFPVTALQVDGGSEFMASFETACQTKGLELFVLPPKSPKLNGAVERANGSWRYEFYAVYDLPDTLAELNPLIDSFQHLYNHFRPHGALQGLTPAQYLAKHHGLEPPPSQMS